jgi:hypothetical protein
VTGVWIIPLTRARTPPIIHFGVTTCHHVVDDPMDGSGRMSAPAAVSAPARSNRRIMWLWAPEFADGCYLGPYSTRRRHLSSIESTREHQPLIFFGHATPRIHRTLPAFTR